MNFPSICILASVTNSAKGNSERWKKSYIIIVISVISVLRPETKNPGLIFTFDEVIENLHA